MSQDEPSSREIEPEVVLVTRAARDSPVGINRDHDETVSREMARQVVIASVVANHLHAGRARPLHRVGTIGIVENARRRFYAARTVVSVHEKQNWARDFQIRRPRHARPKLRFFALQNFWINLRRELVFPTRDLEGTRLVRVLRESNMTDQKRTQRNNEAKNKT